MTQVKDWDHLDKKFSKKLSNWKVTSLSIIGRSILLKRVLGALGIYYFSMFAMSVVLAKSFESLRLKGVGDVCRRQIQCGTILLPAIPPPNKKFAAGNMGAANPRR